MSTATRQPTLAPQEDPEFQRFAAALREWEATGDRIASARERYPDDPRAALGGEWDRRYLSQRDDLVRQAAALEERLGLVRGSAWGMVP